MKKAYILIFVLTSIFQISCARQTNLKGEVFIVTRDAQNIKLGAVTVSVVPANLINGHVERLKSEYDRQNKNFNDLLKICSDWGKNIDNLSLTQVQSRKEKMSDCYSEVFTNGNAIPKLFFDTLPQSVASAVSDSDGKFALTIDNPGKYVIAARSSRNVGKEIESYFWLVSFEASGEQIQLALTNKNMIGSNAPESVVQVEEISQPNK